VPIATPVVKWATEVTRLEDLPRIVHRAAKIATTPPTGPVFISLPGDILNAFGVIDLGQATRVDTRVRPSEESVRGLAERLLRAERPVIIAGHEIIRSDAFAEAVRFAEIMGCPVYDQTVLQGSHFPTDHAAYLGPLSRDQKTVRARLDPYDTVISLGSDFLRMSVYSEIEPLPPHMSVIQIGLNDWEMGKTYPAEVAIRADVTETLRVLTPLVAELGGAAQRQRAAERLAELSGRNWTANRKARADVASAKAAMRPIDPEWLMLTIADLLPQDAIIVDDALTTGGEPPDLYASARPLCVFRQCQRRYRLGHRRGGRHSARPAGAQGRRPARRRQRYVLHPGAMDRRSPKTADRLRRVQQWRLPHHQAAAEAVPQHRALYRDGFRRSGHRVRRTRPQPWHAGPSYRHGR
jgi:benzoylformate decarboxylase